MERGYYETSVEISVADGRVTSGILTEPGRERKETAVIIAHGAGNDMTTPLLEEYARGMARAGYPALRFNFLYANEGRKSPDSQGVLIKTWAAAYEFALSRLNTRSFIATGKSMGGRIASQMAAGNELPVDRLVFLGYPLHPANDPERLRDAHLYGLTVPMLFFAGTRDPLCSMTRLIPVLERLRAPHHLHTIEGGDHSFHVPKSAHRTDEEIYGEIIAETIAWLETRARG